MAKDYCVQTVQQLQNIFKETNVHRPFNLKRYEPGQNLAFDVTSLDAAATAKVNLTIEKFVGGGFAGQVYKVKILSIEGNPPENLAAGNSYAMKILVPPAESSLMFRNIIYRIGFQAPFQLQCNPAAARAGAIWQKFIRKAAAITFGSELAVVDIYATFIDPQIGSCGELSEWISGRTWRLEIDDHMDVLRRWQKGKNVDPQKLSSPEYRYKKQFMAQFVQMLCDLGAPEFARQYEWSTCKSQPNCLKRLDAPDEPDKGLVAVDFRAGLALLPFLPMSPGDFKLIGKGLARLSLVQFDRGNLKKLKNFIDAHPDYFADMHQLYDQLVESEKTYRNSIPDITHNHIKLIYSKTLWKTMLASAVTGWKIKNIIDDKHEQKFRKNKIAAIIFYIIGAIPLLGRVLRKYWANADWRKHYNSILLSSEYLGRAFRAKIAESVIKWHRNARLDTDKALKVANSPLRFFAHLPLSILPAGLHRMLTDAEYAKSTLRYFTIRPIKLYFDADMRKQWLLDMLEAGRKKHMLSEADAQTITAQLEEPYIQKYLKSLAVHICTLPVTQVVSVAIAIIYYFTHPENPNAWAVGLGIIAAFQVTPISPGSICRGLYTTYMAIHDRSFKNYNIALFLSYFKYIGYLAFPIQMTYKYPAMARFMAGHWATEAVHFVPVFGEGGAILEHWVYCLFYNWPLTIRRRMTKRLEKRKTLKPRYWQIPLTAAAVAAIFCAADYYFVQKYNSVPSLKSNFWHLAILIPLLLGTIVTLTARGANLSKRFLSALSAAIIAAILYAVASPIIAENAALIVEKPIIAAVWKIFVFAVLSTIGVLITEIYTPDPETTDFVKSPFR
jgi:hypothetical protein